MFRPSIKSLRANDSEIFSVSYGIAETRNGYNSKWPDTNFAFFCYHKVSTQLNYFSDTENYVAYRMHEDIR